MKLAGIATTLLVIGCSGGSKTPAKPQPPTEDTKPVVGDNGGTAEAGTKDMVAPVDAPPLPPDIGGYQLIAPGDVAYAPLIPDAPGPELAVLHGDPKTGGVFLLRVPPGGKSGLHSHSSDYHAVVLSGAPKHYLAGTDKKAKALAPGSYWFQPANQAHGDDCTGKDPCVLFLVMPGPFDMVPMPKAKKPAVGKYKLVAAKDQKFAPLDPSHADGPKASFVYGDPKTGPVAFVLEIPPNGNAGLHSHTSDYHAVVLAGAPAHWLPHEKDEGVAVAPGTYWFQPGGYDHGDRCTSPEPCRAFVFVEGAFDFKPAAAK